MIERVRAKIAQKYDEYEKTLEDLYTKKQIVKTRVENTIKEEIDPYRKSKEISNALKTRKTFKYNDKLTSNEYQLDCLQKIVDNEKNRVDQRLDIVREKSKILHQLINFEDYNNTNENSTIKRDVWGLLNN